MLEMVLPEKYFSLFRCFMYTLHIPQALKKRSVLTIVLLVVIGLLCGISALSVHTLFKLDNIEVVGSGAVFTADPKQLSTNVLFFPTKTLEEDLRSHYQLFQTVKVTKKFPHTIVISYTLRDPWGYIESAGHTYGVDAQGIIVGEYAPPYVHPVMIFDVGVQSIGVPITDARVLSALAFLRALDPSIQVSFVKEYSKTAFVVTIDSLKVLLPVEGDMTEKARALLFLQNGFRIKGVLPSMVDLRFSKPIMIK